MSKKSWEFVEGNEEFSLKDPDKINSLYFPLANEAEMMSAITPSLHGDIKTGQNTFAMEPVSAIDLHNKKSSRNFWVVVDKEEAWSATGYSAKQEVYKFDNDNSEEVTLEAGMLWHKITRENNKLNLKSEVTNFVPSNDDTVELMKVKITNTGNKAREVSPTAAIPIYGRSADNLRDHRHVTSLLNRIETVDNGVEVKPTLSFDERGHKLNAVSYKVLGRDGDGKSPVGFFPILEDFVGEGGSLAWPESVISNANDYCESGEKFEGFEAVGALRFEDVTLKPGEEKSYILAIVIEEDEYEEDLAAKYCSTQGFNAYLEANKDFWQSKINKVQFDSSDEEFDSWMKWVTLQPTLRRIYGCSFLPHHDYGRGGRGWRDLWQDCLALLLMEPEPVRDILFNNFAGVRIDGSNATIIGSKPGEFIADRNDISRVWMDHGAWPFLTTKLYIDRSGDLEFLLEEQNYFRDAQIYRSEKTDESWSSEDGNKLLDEDGNVYSGTVLEHILVQHLTLFFNVGEHNNLRLEGGDWNDGLDMAEDKGETVAFTGLYGRNMLELADLLRSLQEKLEIDKLEIAREMKLLLDTLNDKVDYDSVTEKHKLLDNYFTSCESVISGEKVEVSIEDLILDLERKGNWIINHIRSNEWIENKEGYKWYNGYYDNDAQRLEGDHSSGVRMTLTGQVFSIMSGVATKEQIEKITDAADHYLKDESVGGYRLNTEFNEVKLNMGRAFGFAFGEKENGAMFSHMAVMYSNALYKRDFSKNGFEVINSIYEHCKDFETSRTYPGIPEYIDSRGRGLYHYLTGSASWLLLTMVNQVYGVQGIVGDLMLDPKLVKSQFDKNGRANITTIFADRNLNITYENSEFVEVNDYKIKTITINNEEIDFNLEDGAAVIDRELISKLDKDKEHQLEVKLG
ncbi:cellobiose phosphorylase [Halobacteroides halobius DSM 5150]|uniref:Cellobiose phosphorylase n=1 Tax=Halobacteroides halobius (strain ATCC 35273 / DSM 5150 / MD-1) TaxID=748449 RepID=L0K6W1_HALHC|nr:cellobiose phosphorylase [Halobacteroides halobius]AGB40270.1 cellobiose phosphorylase [Halobacteroides halobius DSM 5150]